jgi:hypothetical protein
MPRKSGSKKSHASRTARRRKHPKQESNQNKKEQPNSISYEIQKPENWSE